MEKKLIYTDNKRATDFRNNVTEVCEECNSLIRLFHSFQSYEKIKSEEEFVKLCTDPKTYFDDTIVAQVSPNFLGKQQRLNPEPIAEMLSVDRMNFLNLCAGIPVRDDTCEPCKRSKVKPGQRAITIQAYRHNQSFLTFRESKFVVNEAIVAEAVKKFAVYATNDQELAVIEHYDTMCEILNEQTQRIPISNSGREVIARELHLRLSQGITGSFQPNEEFIKNQILSMR